jgi:hypothetical protein
MWYLRAPDLDELVVGAGEEPQPRAVELRVVDLLHVPEDGEELVVLRAHLLRRQ